MGLFSAIKDTRVAYDLQEAARTINSDTQSIITIANKYGMSKPTGYDRTQILGYIQRIEDKALYMKRRMNDLEPEHLFQTMVPCMDGHLTAVPGYVMAMLEMAQEMRKELL